MKEIFRYGHYTLETFDENDEPEDLFKEQISYIEGNLVNLSFAKKPNFGRYPTFEEDLLEFRKKWSGKPQEILIQHMIDSLIIFNHNMENLKGIRFKIKNLEELMKTN